jgi:hypothetical protein
MMNDDAQHSNNKQGIGTFAKQIPPSKARRLRKDLAPNGSICQCFHHTCGVCQAALTLRPYVEHSRTGSAKVLLLLAETGAWLRQQHYASKASRQNTLSGRAQ